MSLDSSESLRLAFKRVFAKYYLDLHSPVIADPTEAFGACRAYLGMLHKQLGREEFMRRLDDETTHMVGHVEQDLRRRLRDKYVSLSYEDLEDRIRECFENALARLDDASQEIRVE
jgi:hypothetical protein